jgi:hypothetical protein
LDLPISSHLKIATPIQHIVPIAMLLASAKFDVQSAKLALQRDPIVRNTIKETSS